MSKSGQSLEGGGASYLQLCTGGSQEVPQTMAISLRGTFIEAEEKDLFGEWKPALWTHVAGALNPDEGTRAGIFFLSGAALDPEPFKAQGLQLLAS